MTKQCIQCGKKSPKQKGALDAGDLVSMVLQGFLRYTAINSRDCKVRLNGGFAERKNIGLVCRVFVCLPALPWYLPDVVVPSTSVAGMNIESTPWLGNSLLCVLCRLSFP